jgi:hypothetical protein
MMGLRAACFFQRFGRLAASLQQTVPTVDGITPIPSTRMHANAARGLRPPA